MSSLSFGIQVVRNSCEGFRERIGTVARRLSNPLFLAVKLTSSRDENRRGHRGRFLWKYVSLGWLTSMASSEDLLYAAFICYAYRPTEWTFCLPFFLFLNDKARRARDTTVLLLTFAIQQACSSRFVPSSLLPFYGLVSSTTGPPSRPY